MADNPISWMIMVFAAYYGMAKIFIAFVKEYERKSRGVDDEW